MNEDAVITIREAGLSDLEALLPLVEEFYAGPEYTTPQSALRGHLERVLKDERSAVFIAEEDEVAIGFVAAILSIGLELALWLMSKTCLFYRENEANMLAAASWLM